MPSIILAPFKIVGAAGEVVFGDVLQVNPKTTEKSYSGSGGNVTGDFTVTFSLVSLTNTLDTDAVDSSNTANN